MKLSTRGTLWIVAIVATMMVNSLVALVAAYELRSTNKITSHDYEVALVIRNLRSAVREYFVHGLNAGRKGATHEERENFRQAKHQLLIALEENSVSDDIPEFAASVRTIKAEIQSLLKFEPNLEPKPNSITLLNPAFQAGFDAISIELDRLAELSAQEVQKDQSSNEATAKWLITVAIAIFLLALVIALGSMLFLRRMILLPIQSLIQTINNVKQGDLSARWNFKRRDEFGDMGQTINETIAELEHIRSERIRVISGITHDLKNPLTAISMSCELLLRKRDDATKEKALSVVTNIRSQVDRLRRMIEDLLGAASAIRPNMDLKIAQFDLSKLAKDTVDLFRNAHSSHRYVFIQEHDGVDIFADQDRVAQVLTNLLSNATKYSAAGTTVELALTSRAGMAIFEVRDRGVGIPEEQIETVFQPFSRLDKGREMTTGLGLGLATVKSIVSAHAGGVFVRSRPGGGSIFRVELPLRDSHNSLMVS